ncbi:MAG: hypothetical protein BWK80_12110 [Desulfobacteraceae bacterium IS3]|nr:MAG: hypothetical protein BWK80_12110 [Desulfobacteraceae bacterium IS3]
MTLKHKSACLRFAPLLSKISGCETMPGRICLSGRHQTVYPIPFSGSNLIYSLKSERYSSYKQRVCLSFIISFCQELLNDLLHFNFVFIFKHINHIVAYLNRIFFPIG